MSIDDKETQSPSAPKKENASPVCYMDEFPEYFGGLGAPEPQKSGYDTSGVWFVYDGDCPVCRMAARALQIKKSVGELHLLNARENLDHPLLKEIKEQHLNLDEGMVLKYGESLYHGEDALVMMALLGSPKGMFNKFNALLFKSKPIARICYPMMRFGRNSLLRLKGVRPIRNLDFDHKEPLFKTILGPKWDQLPPALRKHYLIRPFSEDHITATGHLNVHVSPMMKVMARLTGMLVAYSGENIPVTVQFKSDASGAFHLNRIFHFPDQGDQVFNSYMEWAGGKKLIELMRFGFGWCLKYDWDGEKMILSHRGYIWRLFNFDIPIPLHLFIGRGFAEEIALSENEFRMWTHTKHPLFGETLAYNGRFRITDDT